MDERPILVTLVGTLLLVIGFLSILEGYMVIQNESTLLGMDPFSLGIFSLLVGLALMICGLAAFYGNFFFWYLTLAICFVALINSVLMVPEGLVRFVLILIVLTYITRPQVKEHFGINNQGSTKSYSR